jgi:hypothetical protein
MSRVACAPRLADRADILAAGRVGTVIAGHIRVDVIVLEGMALLRRRSHPDSRSLFTPGSSLLRAVVRNPNVRVHVDAHRTALRGPSRWHATRK